MRCEHFFGVKASEKCFTCYWKSQEKKVAKPTNVRPVFLGSNA